MPYKARVFVLDNLKLDSVMFWNLDLQKSEIKRVNHDLRNDTIIVAVTTNLVIVLNDELLSTSKEKKKLSTINLADIELIQKIEREQSIELYGKKGKNGVLVIKYKP